MSVGGASIARRALGLLDLTSLNDSDTPSTIRALADAANTPFGPPAALCVYPQFVRIARTALNQLGLAIPVASVSNFPAGNTDIAAAIAESVAAYTAGAGEIDVVFPWRALIAGDTQTGARLVAQCRAALPASIILKVIIESGELAEAPLIRAASEIAIAAGADFVKTSTGKVPVNATLAAARTILETIRDSGKPVGFKASGGVRTVADAAAYLALAEQIMGPDWASPRTFRFGASSLLADLVRTLERET